MAKYSSSSPFVDTPITNGFMGFHVNRVIPTSRGTETTIVLDQRYENAPDLLAEDVYGPGYSELWWVIPRRNGLEDLVFDMKPGITLILPSKDVLDRLK